MSESDWAFLFCCFALTPYVLFVSFYAARSPWYASPVGRSLMLSKVVIVCLLSHVLVVLRVGNYPGRLIVWAALLVLACAAGTFQLAILLREQRRISNGAHPRRRQTDSKEFSE